MKSIRSVPFTLSYSQKANYVLSYSLTTMPQLLVGNCNFKGKAMCYGKISNC